MDTSKTYTPPAPPITVPISTLCCKSEWGSSQLAVACTVKGPSVSSFDEGFSLFLAGTEEPFTVHSAVL